jgi:hypothetical protein
MEESSKQGEHMETTKSEKLAQAIAEHRFEGRFSIGTAAIVETLHSDYGHSYEEIASISKVTTAGVRRWRERNVGDRSKFEILLKHAEDIVSGKKTGKDASSVSPSVASKAGSDQQPALCSAHSPKPLSIAEAKQGLSMMFGIDPSQIEILIKG